MSVGSYLSTKSEKEKYNKHKAVEYWEVDNLPEKEREEIKEIYGAKRFKGELLETVVDTITADKNRWVDVMMKEELEMAEETQSPFATGSVTFLSFALFGWVPLLIYVFDYVNPVKGHLFFISSVLTGLCFTVIGYLKSTVTGTSRVRSILETLILGGAAATLSYFVGDLLEDLLS